MCIREPVASNDGPRVQNMSCSKLRARLSPGNDGHHRSDLLVLEVGRIDP